MTTTTRGGITGIAVRITTMGEDDNDDDGDNNDIATNTIVMIDFSYCFIQQFYVFVFMNQ